jgi:hypothetical protein
VKRRAFLQLLGLAGVAASLDLPEMPPAEQERLLEEIVPEFFCRLGDLDISAWLRGLTFVRPTVDVQSFDFELHVPLSLPRISLELDAIQLTRELRSQLAELVEARDPICLSFGYEGRSYSMPVHMSSCSVDAADQLYRLEVHSTGLVTPA